MPDRPTPRTWAHPLEQAKRVLILRIQSLERTLPNDDVARAAWPHWAEFVAACDAVARLIQVTTDPPERLTRGALGARFARKGTE